MDILQNLYDKVSPGGFVIIDDYHLEPCRRAVTDFRASHEIVDPIMPIAGGAVYWRRGRNGSVRRTPPTRQGGIYSDGRRGP
jgi:Macrocin-O-methyltransferase (TylF)